MISAIARVFSLNVKNAFSSGFSMITPPPQIATSNKTAPTIDASTTRPGRIKRIQIPINSAIGIVIVIVKSPHGEFANAFTTTIAKIATSIIIIKKIPSIIMLPAVFPISIFIISPRLLPSWRDEITRITKSCTAPAKTTPTSSQIMLGK